MKPANLFQVEMAAVFASKRTLLMKLGLTFLLGFPFAVVEMPLQVKVSGLLFLMIFTSFFGAAVTFVRRRSEGHIRRLQILPISNRMIFADFLLSGAAVDLLQMGTVLTLFVAVNGENLTLNAVLSAASFFVVAVLILNALGIGLGIAMKSNPEVHLLGALAAGLIAFISGLLPSPPRLAGWIDAAASANPIAYLSDALFNIGQGKMTTGGTYTLPSVIFLGIISAAFLMRAVNWQEKQIKK